MMISVEEIPNVFQDLVPIPQHDGPDRVCVIQYPSSFILAFNYLRAVWAKKELSGKFSFTFSGRSSGRKEKLGIEYPISSD